MRRILLIEADTEARKRLRTAMHATSDLRLVACSRDAQQAVRLAEVLRPDVMLVNLSLCGFDADDIVRNVMARAPTRLVGYASRGCQVTQDHLDFASKTGAIETLWLAGASDESTLLDVTGRVCQAELPQRRGLATPETNPIISNRSHGPTTKVKGLRSLPPRIVAIGASTGGPSALEALVKAWPPAFPTPIVVAQHMSTGFSKDLVAWLSNLRAMRVKLAESGEQLQAGTMYFAPDGMHVTVTADEVHLAQAGANEQAVPSVNALFHSVAKAFDNAAIGILLTGMGDDGADGLAALSDCGARTVAQSQGSSAVFGMPQAAIQRGAAHVVLPLGDIAHYVLDSVRRRGRA